MRRSSDHLGAALASLCAVMFTLVALVPAASAEKRVDSYFGNFAGGVFGTGGLFSGPDGPGGVGVRDSSGAVFVVDRQNHRVQQFDAGNGFVRAFGQDVLGRNEQQTIRVTATGGTYTASFGGDTTAPIAFNASASTVQTRLRALLSIGSSGVSVSGGPGSASGSNPYTVTFQGNLAGTDVAELTVDTTLLTGSAVVATTVTGAGGNGVGFEVCTDAALCKVGITSVQTGGAFNQPQGVAVDQSTGHLYVTDQGNLRVQEFTATGEFVRAWGRDVIVNTGTPPNSNGTGFEVCDTQHPTTPNTPADCKAGVSSSLGGGFASTFAGHLAIVPSGGSASNAGNVLVADPGNRRVQEFTATGEFVRAFGFDVVQPGGAGEAFGPVQNELQKVTLPLAFGCCPADGGSFTLTFDGATTSAIAYNATATEVESKLEALSSIAGDSIAVTGPTGGPWEVEFTGAMATADVAAITGDGANLSIFGSPAGLGVFAAETITQGGSFGPAFEVCTDAAECKAGVAGNGLGQFGANEPKRVVADKQGAIYTLEAPPNSRAQRFTGPSLSPTLFAAATTHRSSQPELAYDPGNDRIMIAREQPSSTVGTCTPLLPQTLVYEYTTGGVLSDTHGTCTTIASPQGMAVRPATGRIYLSSTALFSAEHTAPLRLGVWVLDDDGATPALVELNPVANVTSSTADVSALVNPNSVDNDLAPTTWRLQYSRNGVGWSDVASGSIATPGTAPVPVSGSIAGLSPNATYRVRAVTQKPLGNLEIASAEVTFVTDSVAPEIRTTSTQNVEATKATVSARVNAHGTPTSYRFEWGKQGTFDHVIPSPDGSVGSGPQFVLVSQQLDGLQPGTTYQYRAIAISATEGTTVGPTRTFTTPTQQAAGPEGRAYELVSPADKVGGTGVGTWYAGIGSHGTAGIAAYERERFASFAYYGGSLVDGGFSYGLDASFGERTPDGWVNRPAFNRPSSFGKSELAKIPILSSSSDDLSLTSWLPNSQLRIFEEIEDAFVSVDPKGQALREWESGKWELLGPLFPDQQVGNDAVDYFSTVAADGGYALAAARTRGLGGVADPTHHSYTGNPDDLICSSAAPNLCNRSVYVDDVSAGLSDTYDGAGVMTLANVCTGAGSARTRIPSVTAGKIAAEACPDPASDRPARLLTARGASLPSRGELPGLLSADGRRAFFMSPDHLHSGNLAPCAGTGEAGTTCPPQVYVSQRNDDGSVVTRWISQSTVPNQDSGLLAAAVFEGATPDGDKVFFRTASPLTPDDPNGGAQVPGGVTTGVANPNSVDLYMYDLPDGPDPAGGTLTRISAGPQGTGDGNAMTDEVVALTTSLRTFGEDGSRVYFTTAAPLPGVPAPADGTVTSPGGTVTQTSTRNLYLYDANRPVAQRWTFVANLPVSTPLGGCASMGSLGDQDGLSGIDGTVGVVIPRPDGNCVHASADGSLVSFFTDGRLTADDPDGASGDVYVYDADADELTRVSAAQGGIGGSYVCVTDDAFAGTRCHGDQAVAGDTSKVKLNMVTHPEDPGNRTVFFESASRLVPDDHNDVYDVYQWHNGKLSLVSTGAAGAEHALYKGNDRSGTNVYFSTRDALTWQDHDKVLDVYTARAGGGIPQPDPPPLCSLLTGDCQGGGFDSVSSDTKTQSSSESDNAKAEARKTLAVSRLSKKARRKASRTGRVPVKVRASSTGRVSLTVKAKVGKKVRRVGRASKRAVKGRAMTVNVRLSSAAKKRLRAGKKLRLTVEVRQSGARTRTRSILLPGVKR